MTPFIVASLQRGEQVVQLVADPDRQRAVIVAEARGSGLDVAAAVASRRLDIRPWNEAYLNGGTFNAARMLGYIRRTLRASAAVDVPARRLIGDMTWASAAVPGFDELVEYERALNRITGRPGITVICAYHASHHDPQTIEAVLAAHDAALVSTPSGARARGLPARRRILNAAAALFGENGVERTGVDSLIDAANVAKATFYRHFPSKEALVVAWLEDRGTRWFDDVRQAAEAGTSTPEEVVPRIFEATAAWLAATDYLGCPYLNTALELNGREAAAADVSRAYILEIGAYIQELVRSTGRPDADALALAIHSLLAGSISLAVAMRTTTHALAAGAAAQRLVATPAR